MKIQLFLFVLTALTLSSACSGEQNQESEPVETHLGEVHFEVSGAAEAQAPFLEGLLLLHSFEYEDAREAFQRAQAIDSSFAMAYWGEAMTHNHGLWRQQDQEAAQTVLKKLGETTDERLAKAGSELEKDFLTAVETLYFAEGDKFERDQKYADYLAGLYKKYPGNQEVAAFYALSLLGAVPVGRDEEAYGQSARIAQGILNENPNHPGALHYLIHSYDDPDHAKLAKLAADSYSQVAPDASHALHMPSHIYVALGMWNEVVASNIASYEASVKRKERKDLDNDARSYHAFAWLLYGYLQQGQYEPARAILEDMVRFTAEKPSTRARAYLIDMKGGYLLETGRWDDNLAQVKVDLNSLNIVSKAANALTDGLIAFHQKNADSLSVILEKLVDDIRGASNLVTAAGVPMCSSAGSSGAQPNRLDIDQAQVMEMELRALLAWLSGDPKTTDSWLQKATALESKTTYAYGPPPILYPSYELYGSWLLEQNRAAEALQQFEKALQKGPKRAQALRGKLAAAQALNRTEVVAEVQSLLDEIQSKVRKEHQLTLR